MFMKKPIQTLSQQHYKSSELETTQNLFRVEWIKNFAIYIQ